MSVILKIAQKRSMNYQRIEDDESIDNSLQGRASVLLPVLQNDEKKFIELVASGNVGMVRRFLEEHCDFNINCINFQGVSALHIAIQIRSERMVEFLLTQKELDVGDCALHAVRENLPYILQLILDRLSRSEPSLEYTGCTQSSDFPDHMTPLILAAQCGHYEIIELLIDRGHRIKKPHRPDCTCAECHERLESDDQLHAQTCRLNLYRAICSPAYICHTSDDPILTAFTLADELVLCAHLVSEFRAAYRQLAEEVSNFAVELISYCRSTEEMELVLRQPRGINGGHFRFPRLVLAMDCRQKAFVAHPNTQQVLEATWHGDLHAWRGYNLPVKGALIVWRALALPVIAAMCLLAPQHPAVTHWNLPINRMISHTASYMVFLFVMFAQSNADKTDNGREPPSTGLEPVIVLYVLGFMWSRTRLAVLQGPGRYFRLLWSWYDLIMLFLFANTFLFWVAARWDARIADPAETQLERKYWHHLDPILLAEGMQTLATIMAFCRLLFLCQLNYHLGPLQISLGKMSVDIARFTVIFAVIIISFSAGLCKLYQYYDGMVQVDPASGIKTVQQDSFVDFPSTLKTLFWALFCMSPIESADVVIENLPGGEPGKSIINTHRFTEAVGYLCFACFEMLCVIVILNMLIATMSNTFQRVTDNVDIEWTFGRMQVYVQYMLQTTLPPPYNLIPTASGLASMAEWLISYTRKTPKFPGEQQARFTFGDCCYMERGVDRQILKEYPVLMSQLVQRYFRDRECSLDQPNVELELLRQEVTQLKLLVRELAER